MKTSARKTEKGSGLNSLPSIEVYGGQRTSVLQVCPGTIDLRGDDHCLTIPYVDSMLYL